MTAARNNSVEFDTNTVGVECCVRLYSREHLVRHSATIPFLFTDLLSDPFGRQKCLRGTPKRSYQLREEVYSSTPLEKTSTVDRPM